MNQATFNFDIVWQQPDEHLHQQVLHFWQQEKAINNLGAAKQRLSQLAMVAKNEHGDIAAVCTAYEQYCPQLHCDLYYIRAFASQQYRQQQLASRLVCGTRDFFEQAFVSGENPDIAGIFMEVENPYLKAHVNFGYHKATKMTFVGKNERQDHLYVYYFSGAKIR